MNKPAIEFSNDYWEQCVLTTMLWRESAFASATGTKTEARLSRWLGERGITLSPREVSERLYVHRLLSRLTDSEAAEIARTQKSSWIIALSAIWGSIHDEYCDSHNNVTPEDNAIIERRFANVIRCAAADKPTAYDLDSWAIRKGLIKRSERLEKRIKHQRFVRSLRSNPKK